MPRARRAPEAQTSRVEPSWFRKRNSDDLVPRLANSASNGDIIVIHDGHHENPRADRRYAVETVDRLIPELRKRGFTFGRYARDGSPSTAMPRDGISPADSDGEPMSVNGLVAAGRM